MSDGLGYRRAELETMIAELEEKRGEAAMMSPFDIIDAMHTMHRSEKCPGILRYLLNSIG